MKFSFKSSLKALLACAMMLQVGVISANAEGETTPSTTETPGTISTLSNSLTLDDVTVTVTNDELPNDPMDDGVANVEKLIQSRSYAGLFNGTRYALVGGDANNPSRDFEFKWNTSDNHDPATGALPTYITIPLTLHFNMGTEGKTLTRASVFNANVGNGYVTKGQFTVTYKDEEPIIGDEITIGETNYSEFKVELDPSKKVVNVDFEALEIKGGVRNMLTLSEVEFVNETNLIADGVTAVSAKSIDPDGNGAANTVDNDRGTFWQSNWSSDATMPQWITYDLGTTYNLTDIDVLARVNGYHGDATKIEVQAGDSLDNLTSVGTYTFEASDTAGKIKNRLKFQNMNFAPVKAQFVKLIIHNALGSSNNNDQFVSISEVRFFGTEDMDSLKAELQTAIASANDAIKDTLADKYTTDSLTAYRGKIATAQDVYDKADATADEIKAQIKALEDVATLLVEKGDITALNNAISDANAKIAGEEANKYTTASVTAYQAVITKAETLAAKGDNATKAEVEAMIKQLNDAAELKEVADKTALINKIAEVSEKIAGDKEATYTKNSVDALKAAINAAQTVANDRDATEVEVTTEIEKLDAVKLVVKATEADLTALNAAITNATNKVKQVDVYTQESIDEVTALIAAVNSFKTEIEKDLDNAAQADVLAKTTELNTAANNMVKIGEEFKKPLSDKITEASGLIDQKDTYTEATLTALTTAIATAEEALETVKDAAEVVTAVAALQAAIDNLADKTELVALIEDLEAKLENKEDYTEESVTALENAIKKVKDELETLDKAGVVDAIAALNAADNLEEKPTIPVDPKPEDPKPGETDKGFNVTDKATDVTVEAEAGVVDPNAELVVKPVNASNVNAKMAEALKKLGGKQLAYDITLLLKGVQIQPNGKLRITLNIPKGFVENGKRPKLYHIADDGTVTPVTLSAGAVEGDGSGWTYFYTDHLSVYVLVSEVDSEVITPSNPIDKNPVKPNAPIKNTADLPSTSGNAMAMSFVILLAGAFAVLSYKRKNNNA